MAVHELQLQRMYALHNNKSLNLYNYNTFTVKCNNKMTFTKW